MGSAPTQNDLDHLLRQLHTEQIFTVYPDCIQRGCNSVPAAASYYLEFLPGPPCRCQASAMKQATLTSYTLIVTHERTSQNVVSGYHLCIILWRSKVQISAQTPAIHTKVLCGFPECFQSDAGIVPQIGL